MVKFKRPGFLVLAGGSFVHHVLDGMWLSPKTFLWPVYGWSFPKRDAEEWLAHWIKSLLTDPYVYVPEIIGGLILIFLGVELIYQMKLREFNCYGEIRKGFKLAIIGRYVLNASIFRCLETYRLALGEKFS